MRAKTIDFNRAPDTGEIAERVTIGCSGEYKTFVELFASVRECTVSELCHRYVLDGMREDLANLFMAQPHLNKSLREILKLH